MPQHDFSGMLARCCGCGRLVKVLIPDGYDVDDDPARIDVDAVWRFLSGEAYWSRWRSREDVQHQIEGAWRVVGCYHPQDGMVGFARAISDGVAIAYLADVYVLARHRGNGLGAALVREMIENGPGRTFRWLLHTADAHDLYRRFGFDTPDSTYLERRPGRGR